MSDFGGKPLIAGTITGIRTFNVDGLGRLTGVYQNQVWRPGENTAECHASNPFHVAPYTYNQFTGRAEPRFEPDSAREARMRKAEAWDKAHHIAQADCTCGFYAYFDEAADTSHGPVVGLIEAYGTVTIGDKGFRAEKAKLVALIDASQEPVPAVAEEELPVSKERRPALFFWFLAVMALNAGMSVIDVLQSAWPEFVVSGVCLMFLVAALGFTGLWRRPEPAPDPGSMAKPVTHLPESATPSSPIPDGVKHNYPDLPIFTSAAAAREFFPIIKPEVPTPENTPDFWERAS